MNCKRCGVEIEETNISGYCGYCAYKMYREKSTKGSVDISGGISSLLGQSMKLKETTEEKSKQTSGKPKKKAPSKNSDDEFETSKRIDIVEDETEMKILASFMNDGYSLSKALEDSFVPEMFRNNAAIKVAYEIIEVFQTKKDNSKIDKVLIKDRFNKKSQLTPEMDQYINSIYLIDPPKFADIRDLFEVVKERAQLDGLSELQSRLDQYISGVGDNKDKSVPEFLATITKELHDMQKRTSDKKVKLIKDQMLEIVKVINIREKTGEVENLGFSIKPFYDLNSALSGLRKGFLYGMAGAPRRGKTTFVLELATLVASNAGCPVLFYTWEQTKLNLTYRLLAKESQINPDTLQRKRILIDEDLEEKFQQGWRKMERYMDYFHIIEGTKTDTVDKIKAHAYNIMQSFNTDDLLIVVDYIQKMPVGGGNISNEKFKVEEISTLLKGLSIELNCPVLAISSLNKEGCSIDMSDNDDRPGLYHCKGSGDIEYDLDCAIILAKDWEDSHELHTQLKALAEAQGMDPGRLPKVDIVNLWIDKNRDAPEGMSNIIQYFFLIEANKFVELGFKIEGDSYRFSRIESLVKTLFDEGYINLREMEEAEDDSQSKKRMKIRLKYE